MIGAEFALIRKLMANNLSGDGAWRYGKPEHLQRRPATQALQNPLVAAAFAPQAAATTPADTDAPADNKERYVADIAANNAADTTAISAGDSPADAASAPIK
jgi:hypothetical protein